MYERAGGDASPEEDKASSFTPSQSIVLTPSTTPRKPRSYQRLETPEKRPEGMEAFPKIQEVPSGEYAGQLLIAALQSSHQVFDTTVHNIEDYKRVLGREIRELSAHVKEDLQASQDKSSLSLSLSTYTLDQFPDVPPPEVVGQQLQGLWKADAQTRWKVEGDLEAYMRVLWTEIRRLRALKSRLAA